MGTITMTGYNNIDWTSILNAVMQQDSQPLTTMQSNYTNLQSKSTNYTTLTTKVTALEAAAANLATPGAAAGRTGSSTDTSTVSVSASTDAMIGTYDIVVKNLARAQVSATTVDSAVASKDTVVATGGSLVIGGTTVQLSGSTTLDQLATAINDTSGVPAVATVVETNGEYRLVLTGTSTGQAGAFTISNQLTGSTLQFASTNAVDATDADITVNNVEVTSSSNTLTNVVPNATLTLLKPNQSDTVVSIAEDSSSAQTNLQSFVSAYNDLMTFVNSQVTASMNGDQGSLGDDSLLRSLRGQISSSVLGSVNVGGAFTNLAEIGLEFQEDGTLSLNSTTFSDQSDTNEADIEKLLGGTDSTPGTFAAIKAAIDQYTDAGGLLSSATQRLTTQMTQLSSQISDEQTRLATEKASLQQEYAATDQAIATMNNSASSLSSINSGYQLF